MFTPDFFHALGGFSLIAMGLLLAWEVYTWYRPTGKGIHRRVPGAHRKDSMTPDGQRTYYVREREFVKLIFKRDYTAYHHYNEWVQTV